MSHGHTSHVTRHTSHITRHNTCVCVITQGQELGVKGGVLGPMPQETGSGAVVRGRASLALLLLLLLLLLHAQPRAHGALQRGSTTAHSTRARARRRKITGAAEVAAQPPAACA